MAQLQHESPAMQMAKDYNCSFNIYVPPASLLHNKTVKYCEEYSRDNTFSQITVAMKSVLSVSNILLT